jgi:hypothetical protein
MTQKAILSELRARQNAESHLSSGSATSSSLSWPPEATQSGAPPSLGLGSTPTKWANKGDDVATIRHALQVGIQHNFIGVISQNALVAAAATTGTLAAYSPTPGSQVTSDPEDLCQYYAYPENVLQRLRRSKFALHALAKLGPAAEFVVEEILRQGRALKKSLVNTAERQGLMGSEVTSALLALIRDGYIAVATNDLIPHHLLLQKGGTTSDSKKRSGESVSSKRAGTPGRSGKGKKASGATTPGTTTDDKELTAVLGTRYRSNAPDATRAAALSPMLQLYQHVGDSDAANNNGNGGAQEDTEEAAPASVKKRKRAAANEPSLAPKTKKGKDSELLVGGNNGMTEAEATEVVLPPGVLACYKDEKTLWVVNNDRFVHEIKKEKYVEFVTNKIDERAGEILRLLFNYADQSFVSTALAASAQGGNDKQQRLPEEQTLKRLMEDVKSSPAWADAVHADRTSNSTGSLESRVRAYVDIMVKDRSQILIHLSTPPGYVINSTQMLLQLRDKQIESFIHDKFGAESLRIYRLLSEKNILSDKQIYEMCMISQSETRQLLYNMLEKGVLHLQEVPRTLDHNPQRTFYLWSVRREQVVAKCVDQVYSVVRKMRKRLSAELSAHRDLLLKADEEARARITHPQLISTLSQLETEKVDALKTLQERLHNTILHLDESLIQLAGDHA